MTSTHAGDTPLRAGIAGAGLMARWHAHAITQQGFTVAAIIDTDTAAATRLAAAYPSSQVCTDLEAALEPKRFDILHVCTPLPAHYAMIERGLRADIHVVAEKPMTPSAAATEELLALANRQQLLLAPVHQFLFQEGVQRARARRDTLGQLLHLRATIHSAGEGADPTHHDSVVANMLPHPLALMQLLLGTPLPVRGWATLHPSIGELTAATQAGETSLSVSISMRARPTMCRFEIFGADGSVFIDLYHGYAVTQRGRVSRLRKIINPLDLGARTLGAASLNLARRALAREPAFPGLRGLIDAFYAAVRHGGPSPIPAADALAVARARDGIVAAAGLPSQ